MESTSYDACYDNLKQDQNRKLNYHMYWLKSHLAVKVKHLES